MNARKMIALSIDSIGKFLRQEETDGRIRALYERCDQSGFRWWVKNDDGDEIAAELEFIMNTDGSTADGEDDMVAAVIDYLPSISIQGDNFSLTAQYIQHWDQTVSKAESLVSLRVDPDTNEVMCRFAEILTAPMKPDAIRSAHFEAMHTLTHERIECFKQLGRGDISGCFFAKSPETVSGCRMSPPLDYYDAACEQFRDTMATRQKRIFERLSVHEDCCSIEWQYLVRCSAGKIPAEVFVVDWSISSSVASLEIRRADSRPTENRAAAACLFQRLMDRYAVAWFGLDRNNCPCARMVLYLDSVPSEAVFPMMEEMLVAIFHREKERIDSVLYGVSDEQSEMNAIQREVSREVNSIMARFEARRRAEPFGIPTMRHEQSAHDFAPDTDEDAENRGTDLLELFEGMEAKEDEEDAEDELDF